mmetsp:Transcript_57299/g.159487  ORF Transcript_57299/g.159487 Transcript_57299/m.159487 type:complete len:202 (-) Transcript_57299:373-978(-)
MPRVRRLARLHGAWLREHIPGARRPTPPPDGAGHAARGDIAGARREPPHRSRGVDTAGGSPGAEGQRGRGQHHDRQQVGFREEDIPQRFGSCRKASGSDCRGLVRRIPARQGRRGLLGPKSLARRPRGGLVPQWPRVGFPGLAGVRQSEPPQEPRQASDEVDGRGRSRFFRRGEARRCLRMGPGTVRQAQGELPAERMRAI